MNKANTKQFNLEFSFSVNIVVSFFTFDVYMLSASSFFLFVVPQVSLFSDSVLENCVK